MRRLLPIVILVLIASCSPPSFVARPYDNFTAYYNTFYNAQEAFEKGMKTLESSTASVDRSRYLSVFIPPSRVSNTQDFERAIQKSADVLRDHPNSKWVDDALLLIGKSYFYQQNYVGAAQKFREAIALGTGLEGEARFWLARTLVTSGEYQSAADHLQASLDGEGSYGRWTDMMQLLRGELHVRQGRWAGAAAALERGLEGDPSSRAAARAAFLLGQVRETMGAYSAAARAYEYVNEEYQPRYELSYAARLSAIRVRGMYGDTEEALQQLRRMEGDDKNYEKRAELRLLRGQLYHAWGRPDAARRTFRDLLYGDEPVSGEVRGQVHYALGKLHQTAYDDFSLAAAYYDTAATALGRGTQPTDDALDYAPAAITDSRMRADLFGNLAEKSSAVSRMDSLLRLGRLDDEAFQQFVADLRQRRVEEQAQRQRAAARRRTEQRFTEGQARIRQEAENRRETTTTNSEGSSFLFHRNPVRAQEARRNFEQRWGRRPLVPNWRRLEAIVAQRTSESSEEDVSSASVLSGAPEDTRAAAVVEVANVPRDSASQAQMRARRAVARYELANALFLAAGRPDSAAAWYQRVIEEDAQQPVARRALYALAEVYRSRGDTTQARRLYRQIIEQYPSSRFAQRARQRLDVAALSAEVDTVAQAKEVYEQAYEAWQRGEEATALQQFIDVAARHSATQIAPKALWAAGTLFMEQNADRRLTPDTPLPPVFGQVLGSDDSTAALQASRAGVVNPAETSSLTLRALLTYLTDRYPESPHAQRAARLLEAMSAMATSTADSVAAKDSAAVDSATVDSTAAPPVASDSVATDSTAVDSPAPNVTASDSSSTDRAIAGTPSSDTTRLDTTQAPAAPVDTARADVRSEPAPTGKPAPYWTVVVASHSNREEAAAAQRTFRARFQDEELPVDTLEAVVDSTAWYRVTVGQFVDEQAAITVMKQLTDQLPEDAWVLHVR